VKTKTQQIKPWNKLTQEERVARVNSIAGKYAGLTGGTKEFLREKHEETGREEPKFQARYPGR
jgi:hypothetical protein